jgi:hypothetical protein
MSQAVTFEKNSRGNANTRAPTQHPVHCPAVRQGPVAFEQRQDASANRQIVRFSGTIGLQTRGATIF